jgi:hypothetical protein
MLLRKDRMAIGGVTFGLIGAGLGFGAFIFGIASSGLKAAPMPFAIVSYLAYWPYMILLLLTPEHLLLSFFETFPMLYLVLPILGWALIGVGLGAWTGRRKSSPGHH